MTHASEATLPRAPFQVICPSCTTRFPVDPAKVPPDGIHAICSHCRRVFRVESSWEEAPPTGSDAGTVVPAAPPPRFGKRDPHERARHLARVLVSDIIAYHPDRHRDSLAAGTLEADFRDEIGKSWKEYVDQVGAEMAEGTPYFDEAVTEILGAKENPL
jgi:predicted Zn finger-like uncharacterized protein